MRNGLLLISFDRQSTKPQCYNNIHGYALKLKDDKQRTALEKTKGVLSVQDDKVIQLD